MKNREWLVDKLIPPNVAVKMFEQGAISWRELELIRSSELPSRQAESLIDIVAGQPYAVFECFKAALKHSKQNDIYLKMAGIGSNSLYLS